MRPYRERCVWGCTTSSQRVVCGRLIAVAASVLLLSLGCGGGSADPNAPRTALATSLGAQQDFRTLKRKWLDAEDGKRPALEKDLRAYIQRYPKEPKSRLVQVYLAWVLVERGHLAPAQALVRQVRQGAPGSTRDFAAVVEAAIHLRRGDPTAALRLLDPLADKLVDSDERLLLGEQRVRAAMAARRHGEAVDFMVAWLAGASPEDRDAVQVRASYFLGKLDAPALERGLGKLLRDEEKYGDSSSRAKVREWMKKAIVDRLVRDAIDHDDARLARRLVDSGVRSTKRGELAPALARLAARGEVRPRVLGRQLGFVLSTRNGTSSQRSAEIVLGISRALGLPERAKDPGAVRMVTADDPGGEGDLVTALSQLAGDGASVLVAGIDESAARAASNYAEQARIPTIVLAAFDAPSALRFTFVIAPPQSADRKALEAAAAARGTSPVVVVGPGGVSCDITTKQAGFSRFPVQEWKRDGVGMLLFLGDESCTRSVLRDTRALGLSPILGLGFESATLFAELSARKVMVATAGSHLKAGDASAAPDGWDRMLSWFGALGHDAALLSARAVADLPLERVDERDAVRQLHQLARDRLARAEAALLTTEARGFSGKQVLPRTVTLRQSPGLSP